LDGGFQASFAGFLRGAYSKYRIDTNVRKQYELVQPEVARKA